MPYHFNIKNINGDFDDQDLPDSSDFEDEDDYDYEIDKGEEDYRDAMSTCNFCNGDSYSCPCCGGTGKIKKRNY